ncbi:hypothetical protein lacNasYZ03_18390 [Lactobacillus nasalidis]|uniref:Uncharacterized protein n=1 Tax=Lactobacillus nasalidis TaxID=2797258 RepID=A0ABQ3WD63_9LACO|nr:hypothetical protein lacNasYZ01_12630 [Lactobacillus nasalidis]GHV99720.1 hypothetical protein lacNasYZ02_11500 [Lactobacillus nasalidis]GHW02152.1 hypothetical protein lacNasYZ03_18390 [Lactobacillus nasalidis]
MEADLDRMEDETDKIKGRGCKLPKKYEHYVKLTYHKNSFMATRNGKMSLNESYSCAAILRS